MIQLPEAANIVHILNRALNSDGWMFALYGSCLAGSGNDVDIIAFNKYEGILPDRIVNFLVEIGFIQQGEVYTGKFAHSILFQKGFIVLDMQIRIAEDLLKYKLI